MLAKVMTVSIIILTFLTLLVPVYQIGENHEVRLRIAQAKDEILHLEDRQRTLVSEISGSGTPEALIDHVAEGGAYYTSIDSSNSYLVSRESV